MLQEVVEAEEAKQRAEEERKQREEEERQKAEEEKQRAEEKRRAEEKAEEDQRQVEAEREEAQWLQDNLESFEKGLWAMSVEETAEITVELVEWVRKVWLGEGSLELGPCWHCWSRKTACVRK